MHKVSCKYGASESEAVEDLKEKKRKEKNCLLVFCIVVDVDRPGIKNQNK